jgi:hypothetical protein
MSQQNETLSTDIDDFDVLAFDDNFGVESCSDEESDDFGGWIAVSAKKAPDNTNGLEEHQAMRGSADVLRRSGILKDHRNHYFQGSCPGQVLSALLGSNFDRRCREKMKDTLPMAKCSEVPHGNNYFVNSGPGIKYDKPFFSSENKRVVLIPTKKNKQNTGPRVRLLMGRNYCPNFETVVSHELQCSSEKPNTANYFVNSGPCIYDKPPATLPNRNTYFVKSCPGAVLQKWINHSVSPSDSAYRQAYSDFSPSSAKVLALEHGLLKALVKSHHSDRKNVINEARNALSALRGIHHPAVQFRRHQSQGKIGRQLERARYLRSRKVFAQFKAQIRDTDPKTREELLRSDHKLKADVQQSYERQRNMLVEAAAIAAANRPEPKDMCLHHHHRNDMIRQDFANKQRVQHAYKQARVLGFGCAPQRLSVQDQNAMTAEHRSEMLRQSFAKAANVKYAHKQVRELGFGGAKIGSGKSIIISVEDNPQAPNRSHNNLIREAYLQAQEAAPVAATRSRSNYDEGWGIENTNYSIYSDVPTASTSRKSKRKAKKKMRSKGKNVGNAEPKQPTYNLAYTYTGGAGMMPCTTTSKCTDDVDANVWVREGYAGMHQLLSKRGHAEVSPNMVAVF